MYFRIIDVSGVAISDHAFDLMPRGKPLTKNVYVNPIIAEIVHENESCFINRSKTIIYIFRLK